MASISGYNKNDFFYIAAQSGNYMPGDKTCNEIDSTAISWDTSCNEIHFNENRDSCIQKELCLNKTYATKIMGFENGHAGKDEKYLNSNMRYTNAYKTTVTLAIGIAALGYIIYSNRVTRT